MFRAELGALGKRVSAVLAGCFELDGLSAGDFDGDLTPGQAVPCVDDGSDFGLMGSADLRDGRQWHPSGRLGFDLGETLR